MTTVKVYLIALGGGGTVGCGDAAVPIERRVAATRAPLMAAMTELLSMKDPSYGESGLYNTLYQANLKIERITLEDGHATIQLAGQLNLRGECDDPRVGAQLKLTALQFPTVKDVAISINGRPLDDVLSLR